MKHIVPFFIAAILQSVSPGQTIGGPASVGEKIVVVSPMVGRGTPEDPRRPAVMPNLGKGSEGPAEQINYRYVLSEDGNQAIVEITGASMEVLRKAVESHRESSRVLDPSESEKTSAEDELRAVKRDFRWEDLTGFGTVAPGPFDKGVKPTGTGSREASERAAVNYYYTDSFSSINLNYWIMNGSLAGSPNGLIPMPFGALLSTACGNGTCMMQHEVKTTVGTMDSAYYVNYLRASDDAQLFDSNPNSWYTAVSLYDVDPNPGACASAGVAVHRKASGVLTQLAYFTVPCRNNMELRTIMRGDGWVVIYVDGSLWAVVSSQGWSGRSGVGIVNPTGSIRNASLGYFDYTNPSAPTQIRFSAAPTAVDLRWRGSEDTESGVLRYQIWRNGVYVGQNQTEAWADATVAPSTTYTYQIAAIDYHYNVGPAATVTVTTPAAGAKEPPRGGVRALGSYWGANGENIDLQTGNLNYTLPLLNVQGRAGMSVPVALTYNSQNWRLDSNGTWMLGGNVGMGFGWRLLAGSLTPFYSEYWTIHHYLFADATGAEYRLDQKTGTVWTSKEGIGISYDQSTQRLWFNNGMYWEMAALSQGKEFDAGTRYPTKMQDSNGNQILFRYNQGRYAPVGNSSSRISQIEDPRTPTGQAATYQFTYNSDNVPLLTGISNTIGTSETHAFTYLANQALTGPFAVSPTITTTSLLSSAATQNLGTYTFTYGGNAAGELVKVTLPLGAEMEWSYVSHPSSLGRTHREVSGRWLKSVSGGTSQSYAISFDSGDTNRQAHLNRKVVDASGVSDKLWTFETDPASAYFGLVKKQEDRAISGSPLTVAQREYTWAQMAHGTPYVQETLSTIDVGQSYQKQSKTWQSVDSYGNVTEQRQFEYGFLTTPARTYQYTYLNAADYVNRYIRNRMTGATLTAGGVTKTLRTVTYDVYTGTSCAGGGPPTYYTNAMADAAGIRHHDSTYNTGFTYRGNVYQVSQFGEATGCANYDTAGNVVRSNSLGGPTFVGTSYTTATNFAAPTAMNPNNTTELTTTLQYNSFLGVVQQNSPNSVVSTFSFDSIGRPSTVTMPDGQTKSFTYSLSAPHIYWSTSSARGYTYLDGLGRTIKEERLGQVVLSTVDTEYDACACSPVGKLKRVSMPYAPGQTPVWTTYSYDALGRTTQVTQPGSSGTTTYVYEGNTVKVTGPTNKWKKYTLDAFGNLVQVTEPNPSTGSDLLTTYTYNQFNQLTQVQMTRGSTTQTRSFAYDAQQRLQSETHPETGTTTYGYYAGRLAQKTDARNQTVGWGFDSYGRLASVGWGSTTFVSLSYDTPVDPSQTNVWGRLSLISYGDLREYYSYDTRGRVTKKALYTGPGSSIPAFNQALEYQYNSIGDMTGVKYPGWSGFATVAYGDDRRPDGMTQPGGNNFARYAEYDYLGRMSSLQMLETAAGSTYATQTWSYNGLGQMTRQTISGQVDIEYRFSTTQNDGRITHRKDWISGEEVAYLYDTLGRMTSAVTTGPEWGQSFVFDGFGNLTQQVVTKGSAPAMSMAVDATKNRLIGTGISYDAAGNLLSDSVRTYSYDVFGRLSGTAGESYIYDPRNQRVLINKANGTRELNVYGIDGLLYQVWSWNGTAWSRVAARERIYFAGRLIMVGGEKVVTDRLGSVVRKGTTNMAYYPYGQERTSTANDTAKFGTYTRDAATGLDYAMNRYYQSTWGRFTSADQGPPILASPESWNRYAYSWNDPVNMNDQDGNLPTWTFYPFYAPFQSEGDYPYSPTVSRWALLNGIVSKVEELADWVAPNFGGDGGFSIQLSGDLFQHMVDAGTIRVAAPGMITIGGILARIVVTVGAILGSPVVVTVASVGTLAAVGYVIYKASRQTTRITDAVRSACNKWATAIVQRWTPNLPAVLKSWTTAYAECIRYGGPDGVDAAYDLR